MAGILHNIRMLDRNNAYLALFLPSHGKEWFHSSLHLYSWSCASVLATPALGVIALQYLCDCEQILVNELWFIKVVTYSCPALNAHSNDLKSTLVPCFNKK